jgi:hypothetical protein
VKRGANSIHLLPSAQNFADFSSDSGKIVLLSYQRYFVANITFCNGSTGRKLL